MTTTQTPADIKLLDLPNPDFWDKGCLFSSSQMRAYALACVEADRKARSDAEYQNLLNQINNED